MSPAEIGCFSGDADHFLDDLIAACERKEVKAPHSGFGRDLVPYFDYGSPVMDGNMSPINIRPGRAALESRKHVRSSPVKGGSVCGPKEKQPKTRRARNSPGSGSCSADDMSHEGTCLSTEVAFSKFPNTQLSINTVGVSGLRFDFAAPAFASPKPEQVPLPTFLLGRATKAVQEPITSIGAYYKSNYANLLVAGPKLQAAAA